MSENSDISNRQDSPYHRGHLTHHPKSLPPVIENSIFVDAGPLRFSVEARIFTNEIAEAQAGFVSDIAFDDFGGTLHVFGTSDGLEYLRFDCFENEPHYHYYDRAEDTSLTCRIDEVAEGDPVEWTLGRMEMRLPEMLELAGASELAAKVRENIPVVLSALVEVSALLRRTQVQLQHEQSTA